MDYKKWIAFDFDGVISTYTGWKGFDVLGEPIFEVVKAMKLLKDQGYKITVFTTRLDTPKLRAFLTLNGIPFDSINSNAHNPPNTSQKPVYSAIVDDRAVRYKNESAEELIASIEQVIKDMEEKKKE